MIRSRLLAIPVLAVLAGACDNAILVAHDVATGSDGGSSSGGGGSGAGSSGGSGDASSEPGDSGSNEDVHSVEGMGGDATTGDGGGQEAGSPETEGGDTGGSVAPDGAGGDATVSSDAGDAGSAGDGGAPDAGDAATSSDAATDGGSSEGGATHGPSCDGLPATCGPHHDEDCCAARTVPGGTFNRDNNASYPATVDTFVLDRFEVTVGRFRKFFAQYPADKPSGSGAGINTNVSSDPGWDSKWSGSTYTESSASALDSFIRNTPNSSSIWIDWIVGDDNLPMNCIDWYQAYMFCIWDGGRLPTELEWNYAAAGGSDQRPYPWSTSPTDTTNDHTYAVYDSDVPATVYADVGSCSPKGDGKWGHADMAGNVMEWVEDWSTGGYPATCVDCANVPWNDTIISPSPYRQTRGGSAADYPSQITTYTRWFYETPSFRIDNIGVRCARNP